MQKINLQKIINLSFLGWVFLVPFQIYLFKGVSVSIALILLVLNSILVFVYICRESLFKKIWLDVKNSRFLRIILIFGVVVAVSFFANKDIAWNLEELIRWAIFLEEILLCYIVVSLKLVKIRHILLAMLFSGVVMAGFSVYQIWVPQWYERFVVMPTFAGIFNDPDTLASRINGGYKFNWMYNDIVRLHGPFINTNDFGIFLGLAILAVRLLMKVDKREESQRSLPYFAILLFFMVIIQLSLLRATFLALSVILFIDFVKTLKNEDQKVLKNKQITAYCLGLIGAALFGMLSRDMALAGAVITRFGEWLTLDGYLFQIIDKDVVEKTTGIKDIDDSLNLYGGVGGRIYIIRQTFEKIIIPDIKNIKFLLFGFGPGNFNEIFNSRVEDKYFLRIIGPDNTYIKMIVEFGLISVISFLVAILCKLKLLVFRLQKNDLWTFVVFFLIQFFFITVIPDLKLSAWLAIVMIIIIFGSKDEENWSL